MQGAGRSKKPTLFGRFLNGVEAVGNRLPHPITLFALLSLVIILLSALCAALGVSAAGEMVNSKTGEVELQTFRAVSLLDRDGLAYILTNAVSNFTSYAPLGTVLVAMLGVGVAEGSGFISALLKKAAQVTPRALISPMVIFLGVMSNVASDAGYVVLVPIGALMFRAYGRHPVAGLAAAFAGVSGGFSANLIIGTLEPLLCGITNEAVRLVDPNYTVLPTGNLYFMMVSVGLIILLGTLITDYVVEPRLEAFDGESSAEEDIHSLTARENAALRTAGWTLLLMAAGVVLLALPKNSFLRNAETGDLIAGAPLMGGIILIIALFFFVPAVVFGLRSGSFSGEREVCAAMGQAMSAMGGYIALAFVSSQLINYFNYTRARHHSGAARRRGAGSLRNRRDSADAAVHPFLRLSQPVHGVCVGKVDHPRTGLCADVHAARIHPRADPDRLPHRGFLHQPDYSADELLRHDHCICATV